MYSCWNKNTKETKIFNKRKILYGINNLKTLKRDGELNYVIMVEGYMDAISVYNAGFKNVVASMGTSLTVEQARLLKRYAGTVLISYDGDGAGQKATVRGLEILQKEGLEVRVVNLPDGRDPDDVIRKFGAEAYGKLLDESLPLVDFKIRNLKKEYNLNDTSGKRKYVAEAIKVIAERPTESEREDLLRKLGKDTDTTYESLRRDAESLISGKTPERDEPNEIPESKDGIINAERFVLCAALFDKPYAKSFNLYGYEFGNPESRENGTRLFPSSISAALSEDELAELNAVLSSGDNVFGSDGEERYFADCASLIMKSKLASELAQLNEVFKTETDTAKRKEIVAAIAKVTAKLAKY